MKFERIALQAMLIVLAFFLGVAIARAEWYVAGDILQARYQGPQVDGTWQQQMLPSRDGIPAVAQTKESLAWDVGAGYRFTDGEAWYSTLLSIEAGYRNYGSGLSAGGLGVNDEQYGKIQRGELDPNCAASVPYDATDHLQGGYLRLAKGFSLGYGLEPYVSGGVEVLYHDLDFWSQGRKRIQTGGFTGMMAGPTVGGGLKYHVWRGVKARIGAESHWMVTESGHPISNHWLTVGGGIEIPLEVLSGIPGSTRDYLWQRKEAL